MVNSIHSNRSEGAGCRGNDMRAVRLKRLERLLIEREFLTMEQICSEFQVHPNTVRADIKELIRKGVAEKKYGGVASVSSAVPTSYDERTSTDVSAKQAIARKAARFLEDGDVIYIDAGTTTSLLLSEAEVLPEHLTIITNNLWIINWVLQNTDYTVFALPGKGDKHLNSFASLETIESVKNYNVQKAFIGCRHVSVNGMLTSASAIDARLKETVLSLSGQVYLMADSSKLGAPDMYSFSSLDKIDYWICQELTKEIQALAEKYNVKVM